MDLDRIDRRPDDDMEDIPITTAIHEDSGRHGLDARIFPRFSLMVWLIFAFYRLRCCTSITYRRLLGNVLGNTSKNLEVDQPNLQDPE